jgi:hypothetical protein
VGQLAVAAVGLAPLVEQGQDLGHFVLQQPVHRGSARRQVDQLTPGPAGDPAVRPPRRQFQHLAGPAQRPTGIHRLFE